MTPRKPTVQSNEVKGDLVTATATLKAAQRAEKTTKTAYRLAKQQLKSARKAAKRAKRKAKEAKRTARSAQKDFLTLKAASESEAKAPPKRKRPAPKQIDRQSPPPTNLPATAIALQAEASP